MVSSYPVHFQVDYPSQPSNRLTTAFRLLVSIPIVVVLTLLSGQAFGDSGHSEREILIGGTAVFAPLVLMLVVRQQCPRWWFDWNLNLMRFSNRIKAYLAVLDDRYPSTDEEQSVHLEFPYPDAGQLNRWLPLVKWLLATPHYFVLLFLGLGAILAIVAAWSAILVTGRYPRSLFDYMVGVLRWSNRVNGYAFTLVSSGQ